MHSFLAHLHQVCSLPEFPPSWRATFINPPPLSCNYFLISRCLGWSQVGSIESLRVASITVDKACNIIIEKDLPTELRGYVEANEVDTDEFAVAGLGRGLEVREGWIVKRRSG